MISQALFLQEKRIKPQSDSSLSPYVYGPRFLEASLSHRAGDIVEDLLYILPYII